MRQYNNKRVLDMISQMTDEEKLLCVHGQLWDPYRANQAGFVRGNERLGIPMESLELISAGKLQHFHQK